MPQWSSQSRASWNSCIGPHLQCLGMWEQVLDGNLLTIPTCGSAPSAVRTSARFPHTGGSCSLLAERSKYTLTKYLNFTNTPFTASRAVQQTGRGEIERKHEKCQVPFSLMDNFLLSFFSWVPLLQEITFHEWLSFYHQVLPVTNIFWRIKRINNY